MWFGKKSLYCTSFPLLLEEEKVSGTLHPAFSHYTSMHVEHFERGVQYNDQELILLAKKIGRLATYCKRLKDEGSKIRVEAERRDTKKDRDQVKVSVTIFLPKKTLRAESRKFKALDAVDSCTEKLEEQLKEYKEMNTGRAKAHRARREKAKSY